MRYKVKLVLFWVFIMGPNLPLWLPFCIWVWIQIHKHTSETELEMLHPRELVTPEIQEFMFRVYPAWLVLLIAAAFYLWLAVILI